MILSWYLEHNGVNLLAGALFFLKSEMLVHNYYLVLQLIRIQDINKVKWSKKKKKKNFEYQCAGNNKYQVPKCRSTYCKGSLPIVGWAVFDNKLKNWYLFPSIYFYLFPCVFSKINFPFWVFLHSSLVSVSYCTHVYMVVLEAQVNGQMTWNVEARNNVHTGTITKVNIYWCLH